MATNVSFNLPVTAMICARCVQQAVEARLPVVHPSVAVAVFEGTSLCLVHLAREFGTEAT